MTLHSPTQIHFHLVALDGVALAHEDGVKMSDQTQSAPDSSRFIGTEDAEASAEAPALETWLPPVPAGAPGARFGSSTVLDSGVWERSAPATLDDAAYALMNV